MNIATATLAASLGLKSVDLLRALSTNTESNSNLLHDHSFHRQLQHEDSEDLMNVEETMSVSEESVGQVENGESRPMKRCKSNSANDDHSSDDGIEIDSPPHKQLALIDEVSQSNMVDEWMSKTGESKSNGFRGELKRPDLKGSFRCTLCQKVFCHSSSLSRHRMQAHFKSYTCTLCSKEITSNETLRAHMLKQHQISRMFMCRCCNWAFPDKTSLHMHMTQGKQENKLVNVPVIGKGNPPSDTEKINGQKQRGSENILSNFEINTNPSPLKSSLLGSAFGQVFNGNAMTSSLNSNLFETIANNQRPSFANSLHPFAAAMAAAGLQLPPQRPTLFPNVASNSLLSLGATPNANSSSLSTNGISSNGLFPQLSSMQRDSADLISKLRQRLFCGTNSSNWNEGLINSSTEMNPTDRFRSDGQLLTDLTDNNNDEGKQSLNVKSELKTVGNSEFTNLLNNSRVENSMNGSNDVENRNQNETNLGDFLTCNNIANLMEMLNKNVLANSSVTNDNLLLNNNNKDETNNNNGECNNSVETTKNDFESKRSASVEVSGQQTTNEPISPTNTNSSASPSNISMFTVQSIKSEVVAKSQDNEHAKAHINGFEGCNSDMRQIREHNEYLTQKLLECRERVIDFMRTEQSESARAEFLRDVLKITLFN
ncbi:Zinc finger domain containing protein [Aphelenchoides besseyi]|nr:Zinc finger domain containing protein [Aphelenchoides besseyi]KAI6202259.1 Zinc finger domain containing protein [Aphelenchoides besseyi]